MGDAQLQPNYPKGIGFEQVWAALMETDKQIKDINKRFGEYPTVWVKLPNIWSHPI